MNAQLGSRRSFHQPRDSHKESDTLLQLAAEVAWSNIDLYTQPALDGLPDDLAQLLLDKLVYAGKLNQAVLAKFTSHRLSSLQLSGISDVTDAWLLMSESFTLQRLSLAGCVQVLPFWHLLGLYRLLLRFAARLHIICINWCSVLEI